MAHSRFYFFFIELWPQEVYYFTGLLILAALILFLSNALFGRVWCGYACPQTVWTDLFFWVERRIEGDRRDRIKLDEAPWTADKIVKRVAKHAAWLLIALFTGGAAMLYFVDAPTLLRQFLTLQAPFVAYLWIGILTFTTYSLAGHMREQVCLYMCPWPRIQAALTDTDALNVTYRFDRGEPRMSVKEAAKARAHGAARRRLHRLHAVRRRLPDRRRHPQGLAARLHPVRPVHRRLRCGDDQNQAADAAHRL